MIRNSRLLCCLGLLCASLVACCGQPGESPNITPAATKSVRSNADVEKLAAIVKGDPADDARKALAAGNKNMWSYKSRAGVVIPGVKKAADTLATEYPLQTAPAMGDVIYSNEHLQFRQQFIEYATTYNQVILNAQ